jgi:DNA mismatch repair ATPase MutS
VINETYNPNLFIKLIKKQNDINIKNVIVTNQVKLDEEGRIIILTGPNQGGKTVYTQGIGIAQLLFQTGLYVPGKSAVMSVADNIFTHFQVEEKMTRELGRFGDEAKRLNTALLSATPYSLMLMNESFTSTSYSESLYIARDVMRIFCLMGIRAVFATHFHDLALEIDQINKETRGSSKLISMVSMIKENQDRKPYIQRTFKIVPSAPMSKSYAREIARKYDLSFGQLHMLLKKRGFIKN